MARSDILKGDGESNVKNNSVKSDSLKSDKAQRWEQVLSLLADQKKLSVSDVAEGLNISESTVRRDFDEMAKRQLARRTHGGVVAADVAYHLAGRYGGTDPNSDVRHRIAHAAAEMIKPGEVVGFNGGTTTSAVARAIGMRADLPQADGKPGVTVVSSALNIATEMVLRPNIRTVVLGGIAEPHSYELIGPIAMETARHLWLDVMVMGVVGLDMAAGATCNNDGESGVTQALISHARRVVVVATPDKLGQRGMAGICGVDSITGLVTGRGADADQLRNFKERGVKVIAV